MGVWEGEVPKISLLEHTMHKVIIYNKQYNIKTVNRNKTFTKTNGI